MVIIEIIAQVYLISYQILSYYPQSKDKLVDQPREWIGISARHHGGVGIYSLIYSTNVLQALHYE